MSTATIAGVLPIAHTPFLDDELIDTASLARQIDWAFEQGANGYCTGMVSELFRLTARERIELTHTLGEMNRGRGVFIAGVGAESCKQAVEFAREAEQAGATAVMATPPTSTKLPVDQILGYFVRLAEAVTIPLIVQDASGYVGQPIPMSVNLELLRRYGPDKILFKPEANPIGPNLSALRDGSQGKAVIFEGSGGIHLVDSYRRGIRGTMPGMEFLPAIIALWRALEWGDEETTYRIQFPLASLVTLQLQAGLDGFLAIEKELLYRSGLFSTPNRRTPYSWELDKETREELDRLLDKLNAAVAGSK